MLMKINFRNSHFRGIIFMLLASLCFAINDTLVKYAVKQVGNDFSLFNIIFIRGIFTSILILISIYFHKGINLNKLLNNKRSYTRGLFEILAAFCFLTSLILKMPFVWSNLRTSQIR